MIQGGMAHTQRTPQSTSMYGTAGGGGLILLRRAAAAFAAGLGGRGRPAAFGPPQPRNMEWRKVNGAAFPFQPPAD